MSMLSMPPASLSLLRTLTLLALLWAIPSEEDSHCEEKILDISKTQNRSNGIDNGLAIYGNGNDSFGDGPIIITY